MGLSPEYDAWFTSVRSKAEAADAESVGETVLRDVFGAWDELPDVWRDVFTRNGPGLLAELRGGETTHNARLHELRVPALVVTAESSPAPIRRGSEALAHALPRARDVHVQGDHAIDPAGPQVLAFVSELVAAAAAAGIRA
jgi:esterase